MIDHSKCVGPSCTLRWIKGANKVYHARMHWIVAPRQVQFSANSLTTSLLCVIRTSQPALLLVLLVVLLQCVLSPRLPGFMARVYRAKLILFMVL